MTELNKVNADMLVALKVIADGSFVGASQAAIDGRWQDFATTLQSLARNAIAQAEALSPPADMEKGKSGLIDEIIRDVAELPDRTSPADRPEMMMVSADELRSILLYHLSDNIIPPTDLATSVVPADTEKAIERVRTALAMRDADYHAAPSLEDVATLLRAFDAAALTASPQAPADMEKRDLLPCPFCGAAMMRREALWPSEGDVDGIIHASPTDCPLPEFSVHVADCCVSVAAAWNKRAALTASPHVSVPADMEKAIEAAAKALPPFDNNHLVSLEKARKLARAAIETALPFLTAYPHASGPADMAGKGDGEPCYYCGKPCISIAGDPGEWPVALCHHDDPGVTKWHHTSCVTARLIENQPELKREPSASLQAVWRAHGAISAALGYFGVLTTQEVEPERRREVETICREKLKEALDALLSSQWDK